MRWCVVLVLALLFLAIPATAGASFTNGATSAASYGTGSLSAPRNVSVPATSTGSVAVTWTAPTTAPAGVSYYVTRTNGSSTSAACGTSAAAPTTTTSCTDTLTASGSYSYTVVAAYYLWTASSAASATVVASVANGQLSFSTGPRNATSDATLGSVVVQLQNTAGTAALTTSGVAVTVALTHNTTGGTLAGTLTQTTGSNGAATFANLSIDKVGTYTLTATASNWLSATSASFTVSAGAASQVVAVSGSGQTTPVNTNYANPLVARVTDSEGNPVPNASVIFGVDPNTPGAAAVFSGTFYIYTTTNSAGLASTLPKANGSAGTYLAGAVINIQTNPVYAEYTETNS